MSARVSSGCSPKACDQKQLQKQEENISSKVMPWNTTCVGLQAVEEGARRSGAAGGALVLRRRRPAAVRCSWEAL